MSTTTTGTTIPLWATDATGWPIYDAPDADGVAERLHLNARGQVVNAAGTVIPCNAEGLPMDGTATTSNEIPQPNMGIRYHDFRTSLATIAFAGITAPPATGLVPGAGSVLSSASAGIPARGFVFLRC